MAYRLAAEMGERIAAIACVAGPMAVRLEQPPRAMPVLHIHGTEDEFAPYDGGRGLKSVYGASLMSVPETIGAWVRANGCPSTPIVGLAKSAYDCVIAQMNNTASRAEPPRKIESPTAAALKPVFSTRDPASLVIVRSS